MTTLRLTGASCVAALELFNNIGYGLWAVTGAALAFDLGPNGRGDVLVPLFVGLVFIAAGHAGTVLTRVGRRRWRTLLRALDGSRPRPETLLALFTFMVMLALAGLVRGDNDFWATRALGALLPLSCLVTLLATRKRRHETSPPLRLRPGGVLTIVFCGGLWFWLVRTYQERPAGSAHHVDLLLLGLLIVGMGAALSRQMPPMRSVPDDKLNRWLVIVLGFAAPCLLLVTASMWHGHSAMALAAVISCQVGLILNEWLHAAPVADARRSAA